MYRLTFITSSPQQTLERIYEVTTIDVAASTVRKDGWLYDLKFLKLILIKKKADFFFA